MMPYQGNSLGLIEMLDVLTSHGRTEAAAALELEHAFNEKAIKLLVPDGSDPDGEILYRELSAVGRAAVITMLREYLNRMRIPSMRSWNAPIALFTAARAMRFQFEAACGLAVTPEVCASPEIPTTREDVVKACIETGIIPAKTVTWGAFCERVRDLADGWIDKKQGTLKRGFDEKTIKRDVRRIIN
jgi:hypothetical protein